MRPSSTDVPNFLDSKIYSHEHCPPQFYFLKMKSCLIYLKNCWPPLLKSYLKSRLFPVISGLFELRKCSRKYFIFVLYIFHIWMLKKFPLLLYPCLLLGYWCLRSYPSRKVLPPWTKRQEVAGYKAWGPARLVDSSLWQQPPLQVQALVEVSLLLFPDV